MVLAIAPIDCLELRALQVSLFGRQATSRDHSGVSRVTTFKTTVRQIQFPCRLVASLCQHTETLKHPMVARHLKGYHTIGARIRK